MFAIETQKLVKKFGDFTAVDGINLRIGEGELFGFLGPNGAGKTTTIRMLTTLTPLTTGSAKIAGFDLSGEPAMVRSRIGVVPQSFALFEELTPAENLWYIGGLYHMKQREIEERTAELLQTVELLDKKDVIAKGFSGGMKQRLSIAASLISEPEILFMDEPTTGLDPQSRIALRDLTRKLNKDEGITIVYTTHDMDEADKLCDRIAVMDMGKIIAEGTPDELKDKYTDGHRITIDLKSPPSDQLVAGLKKAAGSASAFVIGNSVELFARKADGAMLNNLTEYLSGKRVVAERILVNEPSLEEVFVNLTKRSLRD